MTRPEPTSWLLHTNILATIEDWLYGYEIKFKNSLSMGSNLGPLGVLGTPNHILHNILKRILCSGHSCHLARASEAVTKCLQCFLCQACEIWEG